MVLALSLVSCERATEGRLVPRPSLASLEVRHTPLSVNDVPKALIEQLEHFEYPYIRFYRTDVTNKTDRPIRIVWFDGFFRLQDQWIAANIRNRVLRTKDFLDWYGGEDMTAEGWLPPGGTASCHVNWHWTETPDDVPTKWAYVAVDAQGNDYFGESVVPEVRPVKFK